MELVARAAIIYAALLVMVRVSGKRTVGQFTPFDLIVVLLLSEGVSSSLNASEPSVTGGLLIAATLVAINLLMAAIAARSRRARSVMEGNPVLIGRDGKLFEKVLRSEHVPHSDVEQALREADCDLADMKFAFLEADGRIAILQESASPPGLPDSPARRPGAA